MQTSPPDVTPEPLPESCPRCGGALDPTREECPRCLLGLGLAASGTEEPVPSSTPGAGPRSAGPPPTLEEVRAAFPALAVEALLGQGGMGAVFRARQPRLERTIALKVLPRALGADPSFAERFAREARALARLAHPGIVAVHDFGCADGLHYLVMEFVDGVNLRELLRRGPLEPRQALAIARELCDALQYAHDEGVVHRDVKPENVLVDARGRVKVADFGLAKLVDALAEPGLTRSDQVMGTPHYMAPEQLERPLEVDHRADLFALGVVLYEMLTGSLPRGKFEPPSRRVEVDVRLDEIVLKALEHEPTRRYQQALEIKTDVEHLPAGGERAPAPPRTEPGPAARPPRAAHASRSRTHGWRAGVLFLLAWILLGLSWNLGPFAFGLGTLLVVAACAHLLRERVQAVPEWSAALARAPDRRGRGFALGVGGLLCVGAIAHGHVLHWEQGVHTWRPTPPGDGDALFERWGREPWALLRLAAAGGDVTRTVPAESEPRLVLERNLSSVPPGGGGLAWTLILGGIVGLGLVLALAVRVAGQPGLARGAWSAGAELASLALSALVVLWVGAPLVALRDAQVLQEVAGRLEVAADPETVLQRLRAALEAEELELEVEQHVQVVERRDAHELLRATLLRAAAADPFQRWRTSFAGPVRTSPRLWITLCPRLGMDGSVLELRAGLHDPRRPEHERAHALLVRLEEVLEGP